MERFLRAPGAALTRSALCAVAGHLTLDLTCRKDAMEVVDAVTNLGSRACARLARDISTGPGLRQLDVAARLQLIRSAAATAIETSSLKMQARQSATDMGVALATQAEQRRAPRGHLLPHDTQRGPPGKLRQESDDGVALHHTPRPHRLFRAFMTTLRHEDRAALQEDLYACATTAARWQAALGATSADGQLSEEGTQSFLQATATLRRWRSQALALPAHEQSVRDAVALLWRTCQTQLHTPHWRQTGRPRLLGASFFYLVGQIDATQLVQTCCRRATLTDMARLWYAARSPHAPSPFFEQDEARDALSAMAPA